MDIFKRHLTKIMIITQENLDALFTEAGGLTSYTLRGLGVGARPKKGWLDNLIGAYIDDSVYQDLLEKRDLLKKDRKRLKVGKEPSRERKLIPIADAVEITMKGKKIMGTTSAQIDLMPMNIEEIIDHVNEWFDEKAREYIKARI